MKIAERQQVEAQKSEKVIQGLPEASTIDARVPPANVPVPPEIENYGAEFSPIVHLQEAVIRRDLETLNLAAGNPKTVDILIRNLAVAQLLAGAERTYRLIFGSQIFLLTRMNELGGVDRSTVEAVYNAVKSEFPQLYETYSLDDYINFLVSQRLAQSATGERFTITDLGRMFLKWMIDTQLSNKKPF